MPSHVAHPQPLTWDEIMSIASALAVTIGVLAWWGIARLLQARIAVRRALAAANLQILTMRRRLLWAGPFSLLHQAQIAYRLDVRDADGADRVVWAVWGRTWFLGRDELALRLDSGEPLTPPLP